MEVSNSSTERSSSTTLNALIDQLNKLKHFRIHTGNINTFVDLKLKRFTNSAEELKETFKLVLNNLPSNISVGDDGMLLLVDKKHCDNVYEREDLKITLKLFLEKFDYDYIKDAVEAVIKQLKTDSIEQLILSFPESESNSPDSIDEKWLNEVLRVWKEIENGLIAQRKVLYMGVADFQLPELDLLFKKAAHKPGIVHVFIDGCCVVNPELQAYAKQNSIQLLTHNDPKPFPLKEVFHCFCEDKSDPDSSRICQTLFEPVWAARYTVWVRRRSLMAAKGFIVQFTASDATK
uniref:GCS light chain n=1 Tax=Meloidogyne incognita TaxID=6306 RepID=A0A914LLG6_MELIC